MRAPCPPVPLLLVVLVVPLPPPCPPLEACVDEDIESPPAPPAEEELSPDEALLSAVDSEEVVAGVVDPQPIRSSEDPKRSAEVRMGLSCRLDSYREQA